MGEKILQSLHARPRATSPPDYRQHLEIETPEHVMLDLEIAGIGSRALAAVIDMLILIGAALAVVLVLGDPRRVRRARSDRVAPVLLVLGGFAVWNGYFILFEGLRRGQTPGKRIAGIRVVMDTGHAVTFGAAAARNLLRVADFLPPPYLIGLRPGGLPSAGQAAGRHGRRARSWPGPAAGGAAAP